MAGRLAEILGAEYQRAGDNAPTNFRDRDAFFRRLGLYRWAEETAASLEQEGCPQVSAAQSGQAWPAVSQVVFDALLLEGLEVDEILVAAGGPLVDDQLGSSKHRNFEASDLSLNPSAPCFVKGDSADLCQDVDAARWKTDLVHRAWLAQIVFGQPVLIHWSTKDAECSERTGSVFALGFDQQIHVASRSRDSVNRHGVGADDYELDPRVEHLSEQVEKILIQTSVACHRPARSVE